MDTISNSVGSGEEGEALVAAVLGAALESGDISPESLGGAMLAQRAASALGISADDLAKSLALQRALTDSGMPRHEVANAMSLAMGIAQQQQQQREIGGKELEEAIRCVKHTILRKRKNFFQMKKV